jgi:hypothetical protein
MRDHVAALPEAIGERAAAHLLRADRQEDLCFALYRPAEGRERWTALLYELVLPEPGEREVHGNAAFHSGFIRRALRIAEVQGAGLALMHSHPLGTGWQMMSEDDINAELGHAPATYASLKLPLLGLTLASNLAWSARLWIRDSDGQYRRADCSQVRIVGRRLRISYPRSSTAKAPTSQIRTLSLWGEQAHQLFTGLRIAVVGLGSVGSIVAETLARMGVRRLLLIDNDTIKEHNLDRTLGATRGDIGELKVDVAARRLRLSATAEDFDVVTLGKSVAHADAFRAVMDCDAAFSCVDRPWARHVLNTIAYAFLVPVVDGGILVRFREETGAFVGANWAVHTVAPGRPCMLCRGAYDLDWVSLEQTGLLDDPSYIAGLPDDSPLKRRENIFPLSAAVASFEVMQLVAMVSGLMNLPDLGQQRYSYYPGTVRIEELAACKPGCPFPALIAQGATAPAATSILKTNP